MPTRSRRTRMNDQAKDQIDSKRPPQRNCPKQLQSHNVPTYNVENTNCTNKGRDLRLTNKPQIVPRGTEKRGVKLLTATRNNTDNTRTNRKQKLEEKQLYGSFKWLSSDISHEKTLMWLRKENFMRETEYLLIAAQNDAIRTNHIKARIDKTHQKSRCRLCGDRDETINHIISVCSKLVQKEYMIRHD